MPVGSVVRVLLVLAPLLQEYSQGLQLDARAESEGTDVDKRRERTASLPVSFGDVRSTVLFIGSWRTSSSIVGALLDAHPKVVVANEFNLVEKILNGEMECSEEGMYGPLYQMSEQQASWRNGGGGYEYKVEGQWQGMVDGGKPYIVGDKKAGVTAMLNNEELVKGLKALIKCTGRPVKLIFVNRNPYDVIATTAVRDTQELLCMTHDPACNPHQADNFMKAVDNNTAQPLELSTEELNRRINQNFKMMNNVKILSDQLKADPYFLGAHAEVIVFDNHEFVTKAKSSLGKLCTALDLECSEDYLNACANIVFPSDHYTRAYLKWNQDAVCHAMDLASKNPLTADFVRDTSQFEEAPPASGCSGMCFPGSGPCACAGQKAIAAGRGDVCHPEE